MITVRRLALWMIVSVALAVSVYSPPESHGRPKYYVRFAKKYPAVVKKVKRSERCLVCHFGTNRKNRNDYGKAMRTFVKVRPLKVEKQIDAVLDKTAKVTKPKTNITFGALLNAGKLPGTAPPKK